MSSLKISNILKIAVLVVGISVLAGLLIFDKISSEKQAAYLRQIAEEERAKREEEEERLSMKLLSGTTWQDNDFGYDWEVVCDTDELIGAAYSTSAYYNNAKISWNLDLELDQNSAYAWRFGISTESASKLLSVYNVAENGNFTIKTKETIFYIPVKDSARLVLELDGRTDEFEPTNVHDIQLVKISQDSSPLSGQYLTTEQANKVVESVGIEYSSHLSADSYKIVSDLPNSFSPNPVKVVDGDKVAFDLQWFVDGLDTDSETVLLRLAANTKSACGQFMLSINGDYSATRYLTIQREEYIFPLKDIGIVTTISASFELDLDDVLEIGIGGLYTTDISDTKALPGGSYMIADYDELVYSTADDSLPTAIDGISDGNCLYMISDGKLMIYDISANPLTPCKIAELEGFGNVRELTFVNNGSAVAISARENGVYFVDISNPQKPIIVSHYDTLELATGIFGYGNYVAICSRYWGVEIVDVTDISSPEYCSSVSNRKEYYDCCIEGTYLYVSVWAQKCVEIYDLSNVYEPTFVVTVPLDGNCGGISVEDGIMYVATGYNGRGDASNEFSASYGTGNGMEIYDVTDPLNYSWLSTEKIDGRYYIGGFDHWNISVSGGKAYLSSVSNGAYIYDVSEPDAPIRETHISLSIPSTSPNYKKLTNVRILPDGSDGLGKEIITNVLPLDGCLYIMGYMDGTYIYADENSVMEKINTGSLEGAKYGTETIKAKNYEVIQWLTSTSVYAAVTVDDGRIYVACGRAGISVLNDSLEELYVMDTTGEAKDIIISGTYLYVAEGEAGLAVYSIGANGLKEVGRCIPDFSGETISTISLCGDKEHIIAQAGFSRACIINVVNPEKPVIEDTVSVGSMYSRNLCADNVIAQGNGELTGVFSSSTINWYNSLGELYASMNNELTGESDGAAAVGEYVVALKDQGYVYFNPMETHESDLGELPIIKIDGVILRGKPVIKDDLMVVSYGYGHTIFLVDISDIGNPVLIESIEVEGNPDIAEITDDYILIPLRNQGLLMLKNQMD